MKRAHSYHAHRAAWAGMRYAYAADVDVRYAGPPGAMRGRPPGGGGVTRIDAPGARLRWWRSASSPPKRAVTSPDQAITDQAITDQVITDQAITDHGPASSHH